MKIKVLIMLVIINIVLLFCTSTLFVRAINTNTVNKDNNIINITNSSEIKKALFDINVEIVKEPKVTSEDLIVKIALINFGSTKTIDGNLKYILLDGNGNTLKEYSRIILVTTQAEFLEHINTTGLANGKYTLRIELTYVGQRFPANTEKIFYKGLIKSIFRNADVKTYLFSAITLIMLMGVYIKFKTSKSK